MRLADLPLTPGSSFGYWYDFGNDWKHQVTVEAIERAEEMTTRSICLTGRRACPPEDIGGIYGYADFLRSRRRRADYGYAEFDPEAFDVGEVNDALGRLPKKLKARW